MSARKLKEKIAKINQLKQKNISSSYNVPTLHSNRFPMNIDPLHFHEDAQREAHIVANTLELLDKADPNLIDKIHAEIDEAFFQKYESNSSDIGGFIHGISPFNDHHPFFWFFTPPKWSVHISDTMVLPYYVDQDKISNSHFVNLVGYASLCRPPLYPWQKFDRDNDSILPLEIVLGCKHEFDLNNFEDYDLPITPLVAMTERSNTADKWVNINGFMMRIKNVSDDRWVNIRGIRLLLKNGADPNRQLKAGGMTPLARIARLKEVIFNRKADDLLKAADILLESGADPHLEVHLSSDGKIKASPLELFAEWTVPAGGKKSLTRYQKSNVTALIRMLQRHGLELPETKGIPEEILVFNANSTNEFLLENDELQTRFGDRIVNNIKAYRAIDEESEGLYHSQLSFIIRNLEMLDISRARSEEDSERNLLNHITRIEFLLAEIERANSEAEDVCDEIWGLVCDTIDHIVTSVNPNYKTSLNRLINNYENMGINYGAPDMNVSNDAEDEAPTKFTLECLSDAVAAFEYSKKNPSILDEPLVAMSLTLFQKQTEVQYSNIVVARYLMHRGFSVNAIHNEDIGPAIWMATLRSNRGKHGVVPRLIRLLLKNGADPNDPRTPRSLSPLARLALFLDACPERAVDALAGVRHLVAAGADLDHPISEDGKHTIMSEIRGVSGDDLAAAGLDLSDVNDLEDAPFDFSFDDFDAEQEVDGSPEQIKRIRDRAITKLMVKAKCLKMITSMLSIRNIFSTSQRTVDQ